MILGRAGVGWATTIQNRMKGLVVLLVALLARGSLAQDGNYLERCDLNAAARAVCDTEARLTDALRRNDATLLSDIYADEFQLINYRGRAVDKAAVLSALRRGALRFDSLATLELRLRLYTGFAVITGRQHQVAREPGPDVTPHPKDVRFTHLYLLADGRWRLVASQITPILSTTLLR